MSVAILAAAVGFLFAPMLTAAQSSGTSQTPTSAPPSPSPVRERPRADESVGCSHRQAHDDQQRCTDSGRAVDLYRLRRLRHLLRPGLRRRRHPPTARCRASKPGSIEDVSAVGNRDIGARGMGNWYSVESEIKMGKGYSMEIEKSTKFINDPVITEYVNRVGQNIVKNSDCKVPFTIKVIDSDEVNAMALPGGFFYVNSGLILAADEEAELAGVMAHETAHVCAHHAAP